MKKITILTLLCLLPSLVTASDSKISWKLAKSEITYTVTHPLHVVHGKSLAARGEGVRNPDGSYQFLVAVPVQSFDSGDNNRDLHMQETTRAGLYPLIKVNVEIPKLIPEKVTQKLIANTEIEFAGQKAKYSQLELDVLEWKDGQVHVTGTVPLTLKDFGIKPPSLLTVPIHDEIPVTLDMIWKRVDSK